MNYEYNVSVVIVCMNNYDQLKACLESIQQYTSSTTYEVILVAYFFSKGNLMKLKNDFPWVKVIVSNEIRGFSANNNLGLRVAKGEYCFVLNDDTYFSTPVIDELIKTMKENPNIALLSPQILRPNSSIQYSGIPPITWIDWIMILFKLKKERVDKSGKYIQENGLFQTYNILGAAFFIRTEIFKQLGFFDERYFCGPEDKALSTLMNKKGYACYVNADIKLFHLGGATGGKQSKTVQATRPANRKGCAIFYANGNHLKSFFLKTAIFVNSALMIVYLAVAYYRKKDESLKNSILANINVCKTIYSSYGTTDIFKMFYK